MMKRSLSILLVLKVAVACSPKAKEEAETSPTFQSSNDVMPDNAPQPVDRMLEGLVEREKGTILAYSGSYSTLSSSPSRTSLRWILPDGTSELVELRTEDRSIRSPLIARDRKTIFFPDEIFEHIGTTLISFTETAHTEFRPFSDETIQSSSGIDHKLEFSRDGRFVSTRMGTTGDMRWVFLDTHTLQELWRADDHYTRGSPVFLRGNIFDADLYTLDWDTDQNAGEDTGERVGEQTYRAQLTNDGLVDALDMGAIIQPHEVGADGSIWNYRSDVFSEQFDVLYSPSVAAEPEVIYEKSVSRGPYVVGDGSLALIRAGGELLRINSKGGSTVLRDDLDPDGRLEPLHDGVIAELSDGTQVFVDQTGDSIPATFDFMLAADHLETGHLQRYVPDTATTTIFGHDGGQVIEFALQNMIPCHPKDRAYPIGKHVYFEAETRAQLVLVDLTGTSVKEVLRLPATAGYQWECPAFSIDGQNLVATESGEDLPLIVHRIDWTNSEAVVSATDQWDDLEYIQPLVVF